MRKVVFIILFIILYLDSFPQNSTYNQDKSLFIVISPISFTRISDIKFSVIKRTEYDKTYEVSSTPLILYMSSQKDYNYNLSIPSNFVVKANGGKDRIVVNLRVSNYFVDNIIGGTGKEIIRVEGVFIMTPKTTAGVYKSDQFLEIRVNSY